MAIASIRIYARDIVDRSVGALFAARGFLKETPELIRLYDETAERYFDWRGRYGEQFTGRGVGHYAENPTATHRDTDGSRKDRVILSSSGGARRGGSCGPSVRPSARPAPSLALAGTAGRPAQSFPLASRFGRTAAGHQRQGDRAISLSPLGEGRGEGVYWDFYV